MLARLRAWWDRSKAWVGFLAGLLFSLALTVAARRSPQSDRPRRGGLGGTEGGGTHNTPGRPGDGRRRPRRGGF